MAQGNFKQKIPQSASKQKHKKGGSTKKGGLKAAPVKKAAVDAAKRESKVASKPSGRIENMMVERAAATGKLNLLKNKEGHSKEDDKKSTTADSTKK